MKAPPREAHWLPADNPDRFRRPDGTLDVAAYCRWLDDNYNAPLWAAAEQQEDRGLMARTHPVQHVARDYRGLVRAAIDAGWTLTISSRGHAKLTAPDGSYATPIPGTSGGGHSRLKKAITLRLRAHGVNV